MTDRLTDQRADKPTNHQTGMRINGEVTLPTILDTWNPREMMVRVAVNV